MEGGIKNVGQRDAATSLVSVLEMGVAIVLLVMLVSAPSTPNFSMQMDAVILHVDFFKLSCHNSVSRGFIPMGVLLVVSMGVVAVHCTHLLSDSRAHLCSDKPFLCTLLPPLLYSDVLLNELLSSPCCCKREL